MSLCPPNYWLNLTCGRQQWAALLCGPIQVRTWQCTHYAHFLSHFNCSECREQFEHKKWNIKGFRSSSQGQVNPTVAAKEHSRVHLCLGLALRKP
ncbi:unnamed protein product [Nezara viridula]|uniref:Uncharacterized protein n=1 Tax=Nezara viridula TaxID=85310 RepID=A0A9P0HFX1_NEZVI|nr:unnamed protein product [Nezara viridula]